MLLQRQRLAVPSRRASGLSVPVFQPATPPGVCPTKPCLLTRTTQHRTLAPQRTSRAAFSNDRPSNPSPTWNPVEVVKREQGLQSNKLPSALRERVTDAIEELRFRVTVGDVAARAGVKVFDADNALKALAYDAQATLEVSELGDVVYTFPRDYKSAIQARSLLLKAQPVLKGAQKVLTYLVRVAFGTALLFSVALVWFAITVLLTSKNRDDRRSDGGYYNRYYGRYDGGGMGARIYFDLTDMLLYLDPNYARTSHQRVAQGAQLTFLEAIFSFVFGDGDPNADFEAERWAALGQLIQDKGGVVTAEEMAVYLDPPADGARPEGGYADESFVLPALIRFGGEPIVEESTGQLLYQFPSLQASAVTQEWVRSRTGRSPVEEPAEVMQESTWELTAASPGQVLGVAALGAFNVIGVLTLSGLLADPAAYYTLAYQGLGWITGLMPALQLYALSFFAIPGIRLLFNMQKNSQIVARNGARSRAARLLSSGTRWLREKLAAARALGRSRTVRRSDVIFSTEKEATKQIEEREAMDWERRLGAREGQQPFPRDDPYGARNRQRVRDYDGPWR